MTPSRDFVQSTRSQRLRQSTKVTATDHHVSASAAMANLTPARSHGDHLGIYIQPTNIQRYRLTKPYRMECGFGEGFRSGGETERKGYGEGSC